MSFAKTVLVCQGNACRKGGSSQVLAAFRSQLLSLSTMAALPSIEVLSSPCLGQCGNGPMVVVTPGQVWYHRVNPAEVQAVVERHLLRGQPVQAMLYPKFNPL